MGRNTDSPAGMWDTSRVTRHSRSKQNLLAIMDWNASFGCPSAPAWMMQVKL